MRPLIARRYDTFTAKMEELWLDDARAELLADLRGNVVEIGAGTGRNLRHYPDTVDRLIVTEPTAAMRDQLRGRIAATDLAFPVDIIDATAERIPAPDHAVDHVVSTLVLCSVPELRKAVGEVRRVLRSGGSLRLIEHVASESSRQRRWQSRLDPVWNWLEGSCHLDHDTPGMLDDMDFDTSAVRRTNPPGQPPLFRDIIIGSAVRP